MRGKRSAMTLAVLVAIGLLATAASAGATITPERDAGDAATAAFGTFTPGAGIAYNPIPATGNPVGVADSVIFPFPRVGTTFLVLSTGDATLGDQPDPETFASVSDGGATVAGRGDTARDVTVLQIPFTAPAGSEGFVSCLSFDYRFLSEEYPDFLDSQFNDAFIAEVDPTLWTTSGSVISGLGNDFALDPNGLPVTIKSTGPTSMSPAEAAGTPYGGATALLRAQTPVTAGAHTLYLSIFDQQDAVYDTAAFVDNLTLATVPTADCTRGSLAVGPTIAITGPTGGATVNTPTPTLTGTAGDAAGDAGTVTVRIYSGEFATGTPVQTLAAPRSGTSWSVVTGALDLGTYTAQASQANAAGINGISGPMTFTVAPAVQQQQQPSLQPPAQTPPAPPPPPPVPGKSVVVRVVSGQVYIKLPAGKRVRAVGPGKGFVPFTGAANIPVGSQLDTQKGRVALTSAADTAGSTTQTSDFYQGIFEVKQAVPKKKPAKPAALTTDIVLKGQLQRSQCAPLKGARAAAKKKGPKSVLGKLWGNGKGKFRTAGKYSSATVRGTIWLTQDECDGTLTKVARGTVLVRDFKRKKTVTVKAGHSYLARAQRAASKAKRRIR